MRTLEEMISELIEENYRLKSEILEYKQEIKLLKEKLTEAQNV